MAALHVDLMSQPSRACVLLVKVEKLPVTVAPVNIAKGGTRDPKYRTLNPLGKVPCLVEADGTSIPESGAILTYLCNTHSVKPHWYPAEPKARARVDGAMHWHHTTLRKGAAGVCWQRVVAKNLGAPTSEQALKEATAALKAALDQMEAYWLQKGKLPYVGGSQPCLADLLCACELSNLQIADPLTPPGDRLEALLAARPAVRAWYANVQNFVGPAWEEVHAVTSKVAAKQQQLAAKL